MYDVFSGAGGATRGYQLAGFRVIGIDHQPQPRYCGNAFHQMDAFEFFRRYQAGEFEPAACIHTSPPCQAYTMMRRLGKRAGAGAPELIEAVREALRHLGIHYVIENVVGAPLIDPLLLCGSSFGLRVRRHRLFESDLFLFQPLCLHRANRNPIAVYGDHPQQPGDRTYRVNRARTLREGQAAMGIDWMVWSELTQAIPPCYTHWLGSRLREQLTN